MVQTQPGTRIIEEALHLCWRGWPGKKKICDLIPLVVILNTLLFNTLTGPCYDSVIDPSDTSGDGSTEVGFPSSDAYLDNVGEAWCSSASSGNAYLQVDFGSLKVVCAIAVQGLSADGDEVFPTSFKLSFATSEISSVFAQFYREGGVERVSWIHNVWDVSPASCFLVCHYYSSLPTSCFIPFAFRLFLLYLLRSCLLPFAFCFLPPASSLVP